jgi:ribosome biogenesis GTPase A
MIRIALAGHTTVGKTTLISTFRKSPSGEIGDMGNTTKKAKSLEPKDYESLQATFIDCPGFQNAGLMSLILKHQISDAEYAKELTEEFASDGVDLRYDQIACEALKHSDVVLYVGDLQIPADNSHLQEVRLIQKIQPNIIGILNKGGTYERSKGAGAKDRRIKQWTEKLAECSIYNVIDFDAHWDKPYKVIAIYNAIREVLPLKQKEVFDISLENFYERQRQVHQKAYEMLSYEIIEIRKKKTLEEKVEGDVSKATKKLEKELIELLKESVNRFISKASGLYQIAAENPTLSPNDFPANYSSYTQVAEPIKVAQNAALGGALGSIAGGTALAVGFAAFAFFTGGTGPLILAAAGTGLTWGAGGGSLTGAAIGAMSAEDTIYKVNLSEDVLGRVAEFCITAIYALSHHGYGARPEIDNKQFSEILDRVKEFNQNCEVKIDWSIASAETIHKWCKDSLEGLET